MRYRQLGDSQLQVSEISLGSWLTYSGGVGREQTQACTRAAFDAGITFFDTANVYGRGAAEEAWGEILADHDRDGYVLATKVYFPMSEVDRGLSAEQIHKQIDASLMRLRTDFVDLYQCHRYDTETPLEETVQALSDVVRAGKARYWGFSEWTAEQIEAAMAIARDRGLEKPVSSQPQYSLLWRRIEDNGVLRVCEAGGISQIVWSPLAQGVLTGKYQPGEPPPEGTRAASEEMGGFISGFFRDEVLAAVQRLAPIADQAGLSPAQLALAWILRRPNVASAIIGATRPEQVVENAAASAAELGDDVLQAIDDALGDAARLGDCPMRPWTDVSLPLAERVELLLSEMTLDEKLAQLGSVWVRAQLGSGNVAPMQEAFADPPSFEQASAHGLGHLTRPLGTAPVDPVEGARKLAALQEDLVARTRLGVPAIAHDECLTGFTTFGATVFPTALAWAATFDPELVERMTRAIGEGMRAVGDHQGLSPVLDVVRDYRWGRVEETLGEDPYLVGMIGTAYVRGLEACDVVATLKHFAGYSASQAARNHAPVAIGPRALRDVLLPPFEMALREGGARSVMNSYSEIDGLPVAVDAGFLTGVLRDEWGFEGVVVSDYWSIAFVQIMHRVAGSVGEAGALALEAGIDVELPHTRNYGEPLAELVRAGTVPEELVERGARRVLRQKAELGLLDADWSPESPAMAAGALDLDPPAHRAIARELAETSVVLLDNDGTLPLDPGSRVALVGPCADDPLAFLGCYSFANHGVMQGHEELGLGIEVPTLLAGLRAEWPDLAIVHEPGCPIQEPDRSRLAAAADAARAADVCIAVVGDRPGLFGRGTSGEGCDADDLSLPGVQDELLDALLETGTPLVLVVVSGRPYALGRYAGRLVAAVQAFLPGEEGGPALAGILSGRVTPSGKLPVQIPRSAGAQPSTYLHPVLGGNSGGVSSIDPTPLFPFGHGLSYTTFGYSGFAVGADEVPTDGEVEVACVVRNEGERAGAEVVQLYLADPVAQVTRPVIELAGFARVVLQPGEQTRVTFTLHADRTSFTGVDLQRIVEPGEIRVMVGASSEDIRGHGAFRLTGEPRVVGHDRVLVTPVRLG